MLVADWAQLDGVPAELKTAWFSRQALRSHPARRIVEAALNLLAAGATPEADSGGKEEPSAASVDGQEEAATRSRRERPARAPAPRAEAEIDEVDAVRDKVSSF